MEEEVDRETVLKRCNLAKIETLIHEIDQVVKLAEQQLSASLYWIKKYHLGPAHLKFEQEKKIVQYYLLAMDDIRSVNKYWHGYSKSVLADIPHYFAFDEERKYECINVLEKNQKTFADAVQYEKEKTKAIREAIAREF